MKEIIIKQYQCEYCDEIDDDKEYIKDHEDGCYYNPKRRLCASCEYKGEKYFSYNFYRVAHHCNHPTYKKENCHVGIHEICKNYKASNT